MEDSKSITHCLGVKELSAHLNTLIEKIKKIEIPNRNRIWIYGSFNFVDSREIKLAVSFADKYLESGEKEIFFQFLLEYFKDKLHPVAEYRLLKRVNKKMDVNSLLSRYGCLYHIEKRSIARHENDGGMLYSAYYSPNYSSQIKLFREIVGLLEGSEREQFLEKVASELLQFGALIGRAAASLLDLMPIPIKKRWAEAFYDKALADYNNQRYESLDYGSNPAELLRLFSGTNSADKAEKIEYKGVDGYNYFISLLYRRKKSSKRLLFQFLDEIENYRDGHHSYEQPTVFKNIISNFFSSEKNSRYSEKEIMDIWERTKITSQAMPAKKRGARR